MTTNDADVLALAHELEQHIARHADEYVKTAVRFEVGTSMSNGRAEFIDHLEYRIENFCRALSRPVPEGFVLVPKEPTEEMLVAGCRALSLLGKDVWMDIELLGNNGKAHRKMAIRYRAMIAAAPSEREDR
jgi:hypothetical protein